MLSLYDFFRSYFPRPHERCLVGGMDGTVGVFGGHTTFADPRRQWDFRSVGRGDVDFEEIIVALNDVGYATSFH